jgi:hypothetical protein
MEFRQREGRLKAAKNLIARSITNLVVIGESSDHFLHVDSEQEQAFAARLSQAYQQCFLIEHSYRLHLQYPFR